MAPIVRSLPSYVGDNQHALQVLQVFRDLNFLGQDKLISLWTLHLFAASSLMAAGARYTKSIASLELRHKEHNNDPYSLHNNTIDYHIIERDNSAYIDLVY